MSRKRKALYVILIALQVLYLENTTTIHCNGSDFFLADICSEISYLGLIEDWRQSSIDLFAQTVTAVLFTSLVWILLDKQLKKLID